MKRKGEEEERGKQRETNRETIWLLWQTGEEAEGKPKGNQQGNHLVAVANREGSQRETKGKPTGNQRETNRETNRETV